MRVTVWFDGACNPNPGRMGIGVLVDGPDGLVAEVSEALDELGKGTSNMAEYHAIIRGLELARDAKATEVHVRGDSNLVVQQLLGRFRVKEPRLKPLYERVAELSHAFDEFDIQWVPREQNKRADALAYASVGGGSR